MDLSSESDLKAAIERFAPAHLRQKRNELFANVRLQISRAASEQDATELFCSTLQSIYTALLRAERQRIEKERRDEYWIERRRVEQSIQSITASWVVRPNPESFQLFHLHRAFCPHDRHTKTCQEIWSKLTRYQSRQGTRPSLQELGEELRAEGVDPVHADPDDFCSDKFQWLDDHLPPTSYGAPRRGRQEDMGRDTLVACLIGLPGEEGVLAKAGLTVEAALRFVAESVLPAVFGLSISPETLKKHRLRLRQRLRRSQREFARQ